MHFWGWELLWGALHEWTPAGACGRARGLTIQGWEGIRRDADVGMLKALWVCGRGGPCKWPRLCLTLLYPQRKARLHEKPDPPFLPTTVAGKADA